MLYAIYALTGSLLCRVLQLLTPLAVFAGKRVAYRIDERFARYPQVAGGEGKRKNLWLHAASVGEVQAAGRLLDELHRSGQGRYRFIVTVTSEQGHRLAVQRFGDRALCLLAPLDAPFIVRRAIDRLCPDLFICVETELWPVLLTLLARSEIRMCLVNGRMSERSFVRYRKISSLMQPLLSGFSRCAVITEQDRERFAALGVPGERLLVCGNAKYDCAARDPAATRGLYRRRLGMREDDLVFLCGSVRSGETELLLPLYRRLLARAGKRLVWIIAPRHLERIPELQALLAGQALSCTRLSQVEEGGRAPDILLVDTMGELADLYAAGDFNFCGGSLVDRGGHNIMEIIRWGLPPYFGPSMDDFRDAVGQVLAAGAGFQAADEGELLEILLEHLENPAIRRRACLAARRVAERQGRALAVQTAMVREVLDEGSGKTTIKYSE